MSNTNWYTSGPHVGEPPSFPAIPFDHAAAEVAMDSLRRAIALIGDQTNGRVQLARTAQANWLGRFRDEFDSELDQMINEANSVMDRMRNLIVRILQASDAASLEAQRQQSLLAEWWRSQ